MSNFYLQDRTALLTGPITTYNRAIAMKLTQSGANVALLDKDSKAAGSLAQQIMDEREINEKNGRAYAFDCDFTNPNSLKESISRVAEAYGSIDIYIDGAVQHKFPGEFHSPGYLEKLDDEVEVNLKSPIRLTSAVLPYLRSRKRGRIIYLLHSHGQIGLPQHSLLGASRSGLIAFSKSLARELLADRVTVNCLALGTTEDYLLEHFQGKEVVQKAREKMKETLPWANLLEPEKLANIVVFLASSQAAALTGQTLSANEGMSFDT